MKTPKIGNDHAGHGRAWWVLGGVLLLVALRAAATGAESAVPASAVVADKTHTLFMGVDIAVAQGKETHRVRDVSGGSFVINVKGQPVFVPMSGAPVNLRVDQGLKLCRIAANLSGLTGERAYTPGHDPRIQNSIRQAHLSIALSDQRSKAENRMATAQFAASHPPTGPGAPNMEAQLNRDMAETAANLASVDMAMANIVSGNYIAKRLEEDLAKELYDAMEVNFQVSSAEPLTNPYVVVITRYHEANAKPGEVRNWIFAKSLEPISAKPEKVHVLQGGFPPGFVLEEFQVHLYDRGQEVATNVAPKRVPLTANEAMLYVMIEYLAANKNGTVPATPALTTLANDFQTRLARGEGKQPLWVKVSKEGRITEAFLDEACATKLDDPYFAAAMKEIRFKPALEKGKPIDSVARLKLTDLPRAL